MTTLEESVLSMRAQSLLSEFVDREPETKYFRDMLDASGKRVLVLFADGNMGKTWLISKLAAECNERGLCSVLVNEYHHVSYLSVFREIRDNVGRQHFSRFTDLDDTYARKNYNFKLDITQSGEIKVLPNASIEGSKVDTIAGVLVKVAVPRDVMDGLEAERRVTLTKQFIEDFEGALAERPVVIFFDGAEKMPQLTAEWLWNSFLADDRISKARFVLAGRKKPTYKRDLRSIVEVRQLQPLDERNIEIYLAKKGVPQESCHELAVMLLANANGNPGRVAMHTERYLALKQKQVGWS